MSDAERRWVRILMTALEASVKLQSHYAELLNMHDGGERLQFAHATDWIGRLRAIGEIPGEEVREIFELLTKAGKEKGRGR